MKVAIDIMLNVNEENEKELFELYDINLEKYLNAYKLKNNSSVKKKNKLIVSLFFFRHYSHILLILHEVLNH